MKVLQVLSSLNRISGVANVVMNYYRMLYNKVQFDFLLYSPTEDSLASEAESYGAKIYYISKFGLCTYRKYKRAVANFFDEHKEEYDVVHIHELMSQRIIVPIAHDNNIKVIMHSHGPYPGRKMVGILKAVRNSFLLKNFDKHADYYLACSEHAATAFKAQNNVKILRNGVDVKRYMYGENMRKELGIYDAFVVGSVGRITEQKNPTAIVDIFAAVHNVEKNSVLIIAGDGDIKIKHDVEERIKAYGLCDNVKMIGNCKTIPQLMRSFDAFLIPSLWEGLPVVLVEAQAAGLPCYCSENIPHEADLTGSVTYLKLSDDVKIWAEAILNGNKLDEKTVKSGFIKKGYDLNFNSTELFDIYQEVINRA